MANQKDIRRAALAKAQARTSRPSMKRMQQVKSAATGGRRTGATRMASTPKVVGNKASRSAGVASAKRPSVSKTASRKSAKKNTRHRSASGSAAKVLINGRHVPPNLRYKTGHWRPVRQSWMTNEVWDAFKAINRFRNKAMSKGLRKASLGKQIFGKEGPGHAGYGTGKLQQWVDKVLRKGDGTDPHMVDLTKWFAGVAEALDYHNGNRNFTDLMKEQKGDPDHFMRSIVDALKASIPELKKLTKRGINDLIKNKFYTAQYGPDGRAK